MRLTTLILFTLLCSACVLPPIDVTVVPTVYEPVGRHIIDPHWPWDDEICVQVSEADLACMGVAAVKEVLLAKKLAE